MADQANHHPNGGAQPIDRGVIDGLKDLGDGDPGFLVELIDIYLDDSLQRVRTLLEAIDKGDVRTVEQAAHALKSASANIGALSLADMCREAEARARAHAPVGEVAPIVRDIGLAHRAALDDLRRIRGELQP